MVYPKSAIALLLPLLAACSGSGGENEVDTDKLTGLYLGEGEGRQQDRICMLRQPSGTVRFGIVTLERDRAACSGLGRVERSGTGLRLIMTGDEDCTIRAKIEDGTIAFPAAIPASCSYYCSPEGILAGKAFRKTEDTARAALRAADLVGNSLCG